MNNNNNNNNTLTEEYQVEEKLCQTCGKPMGHREIKVHNPNGAPTNATEYVCNWDMMNHSNSYRVHHR
jgi:hypothetical protein